MNLMNKEGVLGRFFNHIYVSFIPNRKDNLKQILIKVIFIVSFVTMIVSAVYISFYFINTAKQNSIVDRSRDIWHSVESAAETASTDRNSLLLTENPDFKGWITIGGTNVDNPIYQAENNSFYLNHNQKRESSSHGALFFDSKNQVTQDKTDSNLVIYGHNMKDGSMFGTLKNYKSLAFYKENPTIDFSTLYDSGTYKIYSVFVLNASKSDDNGCIYNISRNSFYNDEDFKSWADEAYQRSIINTGVGVQNDDRIITLITCCNDFDNARLVIMARKTRDGEATQVDTSGASANKNARYPKKWYDDRGLEFPY